MAARTTKPQAKRSVHGGLRRELAATAQRMHDEGLSQGTSGNVSVRTPEGFLITPSGVPYDRITAAMMVPVDVEGGWQGAWKPSSEWRMHADIYRFKPQAGAVVHTHSPHATAFSTLREDIPAFHYMVAMAGGTTLRCASYATFGSQELSDEMLVALDERNACLLANHGMICFERSLERALWLAGEIEMLARQYILARQAGTPVILDDDEMADVLERFKTYGKQGKA